ncbi:MAG TPA: PAS domain S-box protein [Acidobacteriota bacterium]|nr:PAS domain S-box protein [Acidobacteriota bacterium]
MKLLVNLADVVSLLGVLAAIVCLLRGWPRVFRQDSRIMLLAFLLTSLFMYTSNFLEWTGITGNLDPFEDYLEVLVPLFLAAFGYTFIQHSVEERLRSSEARYRTLIESATDGILLLRGGRFADCNASLLRIYGCSREAIIGRTPWDFSPERQPDGSLSSESASRYIARAAAGEALFFDWQHRRLDGTPFDAEISLNRLNAEEPDTQIAIVRDITARKQAEAALRESEERWQFALEGSGDAVWDWDLRAGRMFRSRRWEEMLGIPAGANSQAPEEWQRRVHPDDLLRAQRELDLTLSGDKAQYVAEYRLQHADGRHRWILDRGKVTLRGPDGAPWRMVGTMSDITERREAEADLAESRQRFSQFMGQIPAAVFIKDTDNHLLYVNDYLRLQFGVDDQPDPAGNSGLTSPYLVRMAADDTRVLAEGVVVTSEIIPDVHGHAHHLETRKFIIQRVGKAPLIGGISLDVTELRHSEEERSRLEDQLRQAQKMEIIGRMAGGVAHDFNNLLSPILGYTEMALLDMHPEDPLFADVRNIREAAERAAGLTRQLLAFSRRQVLDMTVLNLNRTLSDLHKMLRRLIGEDIELVLRLSADLGNIRGDMDQLQQVVMNLAVNARDAMPGGGRLILQTENTTLADGNAVLPPGVYVSISVIDTGCGMDADTLSHMFEPFFTTKERGKGTGLGLSTVYGIVKQHGGHIEAVSQPGQGTTFRILFPRVEAPPSGEADLAEEEPAGRGSARLLVVEDEAMVRKMVCDILRSHGYRVMEAAGPDEALGLMAAESEPVDLVLTDVIMPRMNGRELYERLRQIQPGVRVLYMSGYPAEVIAEQGLVREAIHFLQKPFSVRTFLETLRGVLEDA